MSTPATALLSLMFRNRSVIVRTGVTPTYPFSLSGCVTDHGSPVPQNPGNPNLPRRGVGAIFDGIRICCAAAQFKDHA